MCYIIYKTTNLINGKIYVGQHKTSADDGYLGSGKILKLAIKKYGKENFKREILEFCNLSNVDNREIYWINNLNSVNEGYNITEGGYGGKGLFGKNNSNYENKWNNKQREHLRQLNLGKKLTEETKKKIRKWASENENPFKNKKHTKKLKQKWSQERKGTGLGKENIFYGKTHNDVSKKLIGESSKLRTKYIYECINVNGKVFKNILNLQDFMNKYNIGKQNNIKYKNNVSKYKNWIIKRKLKKEIE